MVLLCCPGLCCGMAVARPGLSLSVRWDGGVGTQRSTARSSVKLKEGTRIMEKIYG